MRRVSKQSGGLFARRMGLSPSRPRVNATARMSEVAVSMARWTLRREPVGAIGPSPPATAATLNAMLARLPLAVAEELEPRAVHQQVQRAACTAIRDLHLQGLLSAAQRGVVRHRPVQTCQPKEARDHPGGLPERQLE